MEADEERVRPRGHQEVRRRGPGAPQTPGRRFEPPPVPQEQQETEGNLLSADDVAARAAATDHPDGMSLGALPTCQETTLKKAHYDSAVGGCRSRAGQRRPACSRRPWAGGPSSSACRLVGGARV